MKYIKFANVKLVVCILTLLCCVGITFANTNSNNQKYVIQVSASKTPVNISSFSEKYNIGDRIREVKFNGWNRYVIGNFSSHMEASDYAETILKNTKLKEVFVKQLVQDTTKKDNETQVTDTFRKESLTQDTAIHKELVKKESNVLKSSKTDNGKVDYLKPGNSKFDTKNIDNYFLNLFVTEGEVQAIKKYLISYGDNYFPQFLKRFYRKSIETSFQFPIIIFLSFFILFFVLNITTVLVILNHSVKNKNRKIRYLSVYGKMYEEALLNYFFGEVSWEHTLIKLKHIKRPVNRRVMVDILINFHQNLKGELDKLIPEIFIKLDLHKDALKSTSSLFSYKKVQAIQQLTYLYPDGAKEIVPGLINDSNDAIRSEAQTAFVQLNKTNPFKFLKTLTKPFSRWTQLSAFYLLRLHQLPVPSFADFLFSKHVDVRNFCLRMIIYFQQLENVSSIFQMLKSKIEQTRYLAYKAINDLRLYDGRILIKQKFRYETEPNKLEIIKALRNIGEPEDIDFLEIVIKSESVSLKTEACRSMYYMNSKGKERLLELCEKSDPELELYIAHVTDPRN